MSFILLLLLLLLLLVVVVVVVVVVLSKVLQVRKADSVATICEPIV
jgi:hypothetical protein